MSDTYLNSPLRDPAFLEASPSDTLAEALSSGSPLVEQLAVSSREGNDLTEEGLGRDLLEMTHGQLVAKYGEQIANQRGNISQELTEQRRVQDAQRTTGQQAGDVALGALGGLTSMVGGLASTALAAAGSGNNIRDVVGSAVNDEIAAGVDTKNELLQRGSVVIAQGTDIATNWLNDQKSQEFLDRQNLSNVEAQLDAADSLAQYERDVAEGGSEFMASVARIGRDTLNTGERILSDGALVTDTIAQALGSLGPSAKIAAGTGKLATRLSDALGVDPLSTGQKFITSAGVAAGVGASEASGAYTDTVNAVMGRSFDDMMGSPEFIEFIDGGMDPARAQELVAASAGLEAFHRQFPTAAALTLATGAGKFNAAPITTMRGNMVDQFSELGKQALEEGLQGGSAQFNQNVAIQNQVDPSQLLAESVGEQIATGAIGGAGMAGVLAGPGQVARVGGTGINALSSVPGIIKAAADKIPAVRLSQTTETVTPGIETYSPETPQPVSPEFSEMVGASAGQSNAEVSEAGSAFNQETNDATAQTIAASPDLGNVEALLNEAGYAITEKLGGGQSRVVMGTSDPDVVIRIGEEYQEGYLDHPNVLKPIARQRVGNLIVEVMPKVQTISTQAESDPIAAVVQKDGLLWDDATIENAGTTADGTPVIIDGNVKKSGVNSIRAFPDLFGNAPSKGESISTRTTAGKVVDKVKAAGAAVKAYSQEATTFVRSEFENTNLNETQSENTELNDTEIGSAVEVAKVNPANVNPSFVNKILKQPAGTVSDEEVKLLRAASEIATTVNNHMGQQVEISNNERVALSQKPAYQANPNRLKPEMKIEDASRSIQVGGFAGARSINDFAADIFVGAQSETKEVSGSDGVLVPVAEVASEFAKFVEHMTNKTDALSRSAAEADSKGKGTQQSFRSLSLKGRKMVNPGEAGSARPVTYQGHKLNGVRFAQEVENDARAAANVYNTLARTFPELFPAGEVAVPALNIENTNEGPTLQEESTDPVAENESNTETNSDGKQEVQETEVEPDNTTAPEAIEEASDAPAADATEEAITAEEDAAAQEVVSDRDTYELPQIFQDSFTPTGAEVDYTDGASLIGKVQSPEYKQIAKALLRPISVRMNQRLKTVKFDKNHTVAEALASDSVDPTAIRQYKNTMFVNPETGQYDPALLSMATVALIDWMSSARATDPALMDDTLEDMGVNFSDLTDQNMRDLMFGVSPRQVSESVARSVLKIWNMTEAKDAPIINSRGAVESLVKELISVSADIGLIEMTDLPVRKDGKLVTAKTINIERLKKMQEKIGLEARDSVAKLVAPEDTNGPSIGTPIATTSSNQNRSSVPLSGIEKAALKRMQDTPHFISEGVSGFVSALGFPVLNNVLGFRDATDLSDGHPLKASITGKNLSIERDFEDAMALVDAINGQNSDEAVPVYYPVGISKVGRHQFKGINPQNNKILRAMVTPTHSTLDMTNQADKDAFWLTVAQAADLFKVENQDHKMILENVEAAFNERFGEATDLAQQWVETGEIDSVAFGEAIGTAEMAEISAVVAVAQYRFAVAKGTEAEFNTTMSFELDGKTDGPANMMSNFGQGELTQSDFENFQRVGFFLGTTEGTLNELFTQGEVDLYEVTSKTAQRELATRIGNAKGNEKAMLHAVARFSAAFGDLKISDGQYEMTRSTSKSPMTKTVYGSGVRGVAAGIAQDMVLEFYEQMLKVPAGQDAASFLGYPNLAEDFKTIFGETLVKGEDWRSTFLDGESMKRFEDTVTKGLGDILSTTAKKVIGDKITNVNDALVFLTNVQTNFLQALFQRRLEELAEKRASEGKLRRNKQGKGIISELSNRDYNNLVRELRAYAPTYSNGTQTLAVGSFEPAASNIELSSTMDGALRMPATMAQPALAGVKVIPYLSIGRGDAMMMNTIYSADNAPTDTLPVFDGIDMPINKVFSYANQINEAVMQNWDRDVLADVEADFSTFLESVGDDSDLLEAAFAATKEAADKTSVTALNAQELLEAVQEMHKQNQARKAAFKNIPVSVDHMGGSNSAYTRGEGEADLAQINHMIRREINNVPDAVFNNETDIGMESDTPVGEAVEGEFNTVGVAPATTVIDALLKSTKSAEIRQVLKAIRSEIPEGARVVTGPLDMLQDYRRENFATDGQTLVDANGMYDVENNVIFMVNNNAETMSHELVHLATFGKVLAHYEGNRDEAVERLELLMNEFMGMDFSKESPELQAAANKASASILLNQNSGTAMSKAVALNEFMAWNLSNQDLINKTKATETQTLTKKVIALISRVLGGAVPRDMFSNILFNTRMLGQGGNGNGGDGNDGSGDGVSDAAKRFSNFWIDLVRERLDNSVTDGTVDQDQLIRYVASSKSLVRDLDFGGFSMSEYQKQTFMAIHTVLATEMRLDPTSGVALHKMFEHVSANLSPNMFGSVNSAERFQTVMDMFGNTSNDEDVSDAVAVLLALSQTSNGFRAALDKLPEPESPIYDGNLDGFLEATTSKLMAKVLGSIDTADGSAAEELIIQEGDKEYSLLKGLMSNINRANKATSGAMDLLAGRASEFDRKMKDEDANALVQAVTGSVALASSFLTEDRSKLAAKGLKDVTHFGQALDHFVPIREFVTEVVGTDSINSSVVALLDRTNYAVSSVRQAFREDLPNILAGAFENKPTADQWKTMHAVLGKTDFAALFDVNNPNASLGLVMSEARLTKKIEAAEKAIVANYSKDGADFVLTKAQQLANFMNGNGAGHQMLKNAYAINKITTEFDANMTAEIDQLISLYALQGQSVEAKQEIVDLYNADPDGVSALVVYMQGLNRQEEDKITKGLVSTEAQMNGYKGFIPDQGSGGAQLVIRNDKDMDSLVRKGFTRVADASADLDFSSNTYGYYATTVKQGGMYSQGVIQSVQASYRGVDADTGQSVNGTTSGYINDAASVQTITSKLEQLGDVSDDKEVLIPVFDADGVIGYERALNPDLKEAYTAPRSNLALMVGAWAGRQAEEQFARKYNAELIQAVKDIYDNREEGTDGLFVDMSKSDDPIFADSWNVISPETRLMIEEIFGEEGGFMIRKDMVNLTTGYREPSIVDVWSGKTRLPEGVQTTVRATAKALLGDKAIPILSQIEEGTQGVISSAKDLIVVRSLVVPFMNAQANMLQLATRGVGVKSIVKGTRAKLVEIEQYNENVTKIIELNARIQLAGTDKNQVKILQKQRQAVWDQNARMSIAPLVAAGAYKNISEGITEMDKELTGGGIVDYVEGQLDRLPGKLQTVAKYALVSRDTPIYKAANKSVQYGDFIAKAIYYDHMVEQGKTHDEAMQEVNEEFVNFSVLPGRTRSYLESMGGSWFLAFKIRIMKIGLKTLQNNPVGALITGGLAEDVGSPVDDNLLSVAADGRLDYSLGSDMLFGAPDLNPWINLIDWAKD